MTGPVRGGAPAKKTKHAGDASAKTTNTTTTKKTPNAASTDPLWQPDSERVRTGQPARPAEKTQPNGGVDSVTGLNPAVSAEQQRQTYERVFALGAKLAGEGKVPVIVIDHRLTGMDDRPIIEKGMKELADRNDIAELKDIKAALANGTIKFLPGYTEQASDHWRAEHKELVAKYPNAFGPPGERIPIGFMGQGPDEANANSGLQALLARWAAETQGKGQVVFAGSGTGSQDQFKSVYTRDVASGGAGLQNPDVRHDRGLDPNGQPWQLSVSPEAAARAKQKVDEYNARHPNDPPVKLDGDSSGKASWVELIERETGPNGEEKVVAAFIDDRTHNRFAAEAASKLGEELIDIKAIAPGISWSQSDKENPNVVSTFKPDPSR